MDIGNSLPVQWLGPDAFTVVDIGSIPGWGTKIAKATWHCQKNKQTKPPDGWINKVWLIHTREYDSAFIKKEGTLSHTMTGRKLEDITLSEISQTQKDKSYTIPLRCTWRSQVHREKAEGSLLESWEEEGLGSV